MKISNFQFPIFNYCRGQVMLLTVLILGGSILGASIIAGYLMLLKIRGASDITNSTKAIFAADTGIEWELYKQFKSPDYPKPSLSNNTNFTSSNDGTVIKSIGQSGNSFRAFELELSGATTLPNHAWISVAGCNNPPSCPSGWTSYYSYNCGGVGACGSCGSNYYITCHKQASELEPNHAWISVAGCNNPPSCPSGWTSYYSYNCGGVGACGSCGSNYYITCHKNE